MNSNKSNLHLVKSTVVERNETYSEGLASLGELIEHGDQWGRRIAVFFLLSLR